MHRKDYTYLIGQRSGQLLVVDIIRKGVVPYLVCVCDCGRQTKTRAQNFGTTKSCGCLRKSVRRDYTGQRFNKLTVLKSVSRVHGASRWLCKCDCGKTKIIRACNLAVTQSCGCVKFTSTPYKRDQAFRRYWLHFKNLKPDIKACFTDFTHFGQTQYPSYLALKCAYLNRKLVLVISNPTQPISPSNLKWELLKGQLGAKNRHGRFIEWQGEQGNLAHWARRLNLTRERARQLHKEGRLIQRLEAL